MKQAKRCVSDLPERRAAVGSSPRNTVHRSFGAHVVGEILDDLMSCPGVHQECKERYCGKGNKTASGGDN